MEFQFGTNWSRFSQLTGGRHRASRWRWKACSRSSWSRRFWACSCSAKSAWDRWPLVGGIPGVSRILAVGIFHHRDQCLDAASCRLHAPPDGSFEVTSFWGVLTNPWALLQYTHTMSGAVITGAFVMAARGRFYLLSNGTSEYGAHLCTRRRDRRTDRPRPPDLSDRRPARQIHGPHQPVTTAAMEALFQYRNWRAPGHPRPARCGAAAHRQSHRRQQSAELSDLRHHCGRGQRSERISQRPVAHQHPAAVLRYHIMAGLGTIFVAIMALSVFLLWRGSS